MLSAVDLHSTDHCYSFCVMTMNYARTVVVVVVAEVVKRTDERTAGAV